MPMDDAHTVLLLGKADFSRFTADCLSAKVELLIQSDPMFQGLLAATKVLIEIGL